MLLRVSSKKATIWMRQIMSSRCINASALKIETTQSPKKKTPKEKLTFGTTFSDHMLCVEWDKEKKWSNPKIIPFQDLKLSPAASALQYGKN